MEVERRNPGKSIEKRLKPLLVSMKIFGLYFDPQQDSNTLERAPNGRINKSTRILAVFSHQMYCYMVLLLLWCSFVRAVAGLFPLNDGLPMRIVLTSWNLQCTLNATFTLVSCQRLSHFRSFYKHWDSLSKNDLTKEIRYEFKCPLEYFKSVTTGGWVVFSINITAFFVVTLGNISGFKLFLNDIARPFPVGQWTVALSLVVCIFSTGAWVFPVIFVAVISRVIKDTFLRCRQDLSEQIQESEDLNRLPEFRSHYTPLCEVVDIISRSFRWILGVSFPLQILQSCFVSYQMINGPWEMVAICIYPYWLGGSIIIIVLLTRSSSSVHEAAHCLLDVIFNIGAKNASPELQGQLVLLLSKLTRTSTGFTVINFFVIKKEFLLTLGGLFITYFFLLQQLKI